LFVRTNERCNGWTAQRLARPIIDHPPLLPREGGIDFAA
jgi:hypothetical protein